jgi:transposase InsO family protein
LQTIPITWPFVVWGLDLVGPLQKAPGGFSHLLVAIDKFSKWIEVRPLTSIRSEQSMAFFTNIIHRFRVPNSIITNNGTQFTEKKFLDFCDDHHIRVDWATVAHPMTNGQVQRCSGIGRGSSSTLGVVSTLGGTWPGLGQRPGERTST